MANIPAKTCDRNILTVAQLLKAGTLDLVNEIQTAPYCYGSSCGGVLVKS